MSSIAGKRGNANHSVYVVAKFGLNGLTQSIAKKLGPRGICVNNVCPIALGTPGFIEALEGDASQAQDGVSDFLTRFTREQSALNRLPTGREIAQVALMLCSKEASAITGQSLKVECDVFPQ